MAETEKAQKINKLNKLTEVQDKAVKCITYFLRRRRDRTRQS